MCKSDCKHAGRNRTYLNSTRQHEASKNAVLDVPKRCQTTQESGNT